MAAIPSDIRLLGTARQAGQRLAAMVDDAEARSLVDAIDVVLNEMALRHDDAFFADYRARGLALAAEGAALAGMPELADDASVEDVTRRLEEVVDVLSASHSAEAQALLDRIVAWEDSLYAHRMAEAVDNGRIDDPRARFTRDAFETYLRQRHPDWRDLKVTAFRILPGGFSKITVLVETTDAVNGAQGMVIRAEPGLKFIDIPGAEIVNEFPVVQLAWAAGVPVAEPLWLEEDRSHFGQRFMVSRRAAGEIYGTIAGAHAPLPADTGREVARALAHLHTLDLSVFQTNIAASHLSHWAQFRTMPENTHAFLTYWSDLGRDMRIGPSPLIRRAFNWLFANIPPDDGARPVLIHGDFGLHNVLIDQGRVSAILDWEISRIGDPAEELTLFMSSTDGVVDKEQFFAWYREAGGLDIDEFRLRYFDVYHAVKMATCALAVLRRIEEYREAGIQLAVFGLRYLHYITSRLTGLIRAAEACRDSS